MRCRYGCSIPHPTPPHPSSAVASSHRGTTTVSPLPTPWNRSLHVKLALLTQREREKGSTCIGRIHQLRVVVSAVCSLRTRTGSSSLCKPRVTGLGLECRRSTQPQLLLVVVYRGRAGADPPRPRKEKKNHTRLGLSAPLCRYSYGALRPLTSHPHSPPGARLPDPGSGLDGTRNQPSSSRRPERCQVIRC